MFKKLLTFIGLFLFVSVSTASAALSLSVEDIPPAVDADTYTITVNTTPGAKITVTGGPTQLPPTTDTDEDGVVEITVGLTQNKENNFSIVAEKDGNRSDSVSIIINESAAEAGDYAQNSGADITPPNRPILDDYENELDAKTIELTGIAEGKSTVIASKTDGTELDSVKASNDGEFSLTVKLEQNKRNRINIFAKDDAGNTSTSIQAVIVELGEAEEEEEEPETTETETTEEEKNEDSDIATPFTDIANHWAKEYINSLRIAGIVGGKSEGIFAPDDYLTRAELTKIALNAFDVNLHNVSTKPFSDVSTVAWYAPFVETAKEEGIVKGYNDGFRPNQNVTRAEALKILLTTAELDIPEATTDFIDVPEGSWYENYVAFAESNEIVGGYPDETFQPNRAITRAEIAKITVKTMELYSAKLAEEAEKAEEEKKEEESDTTEEKTENPDLVDGNRLYKNTNFGFSLQYYKNWYYEGITGSGDTVIQVGFSDVEDAIENAIVTLELKTDSLEKIEKENLNKETTDEEIRYFVEYSDSKHIEIYGNTDVEDKIKVMAETLEMEK